MFPHKLKEILYFLGYLSKSPFIEIYSLFRSVSVDKSKLRLITRPKFVVDILMWIILVSLILGYYTKTSMYLFIVLVFAYFWKLWVAGDWRKEMRDKNEQRIKEAASKDSG